MDSLWLHGRAADVAARHRWAPKPMAYVVAYAELTLGLGLMAGF
ncbi:hypothetical protein [Streptomyces sp. NPDC004658]